jgi:hypothetical protein
MQRLKSLVAAAAVLAALAASVVSVPALANENQSGAINSDTHQIHGSVKSIGDKWTFTVHTERGGGLDVTVKIPNNNGTSQLSLPPGFARHKALVRSHLITDTTQLAVGDRVVVQGRMATDNSGQFIARRIHVLHHQKAHHVTGKFVSFSSNTLTLNVDGTNKTFTTNSSTVIRPEGTDLSKVAANTLVTVVTRDGTTALAVHVHSS